MILSHRKSVICKNIMLGIVGVYSPVWYISVYQLNGGESILLPEHHLPLPPVSQACSTKSLLKQF